MRNYKKNMLLTYVSITYLFSLSILITVLLTKFYYTYNYYKGIYLGDNTIEVYIKDKDYKYLRKNPYIYSNSKRIKVKILGKDSYTKNNYTLVLLKSKKISKKTKLNISIYKGKKNLFNMLIKPWR